MHTRKQDRVQSELIQLIEAGTEKVHENVIPWELSVCLGGPQAFPKMSDKDSTQLHLDFKRHSACSSEFDIWVIQRTSYRFCPQETYSLVGNTST